tara:strand:- start:1862 stop:2803 length:942 start_codon:yes stop_codon:yes gene_type:complete
MRIKLGHLSNIQGTEVYLSKGSFIEKESISVSFEFFPTSSEKLEKQLWESVLLLAPLKPSFVSVTYGAGGNTRQRTFNTVKRIVTETPLIPAAHLTCIGSTSESLQVAAKEYWDVGVRHLVALRGDPEQKTGKFIPHPKGYKNAGELVRGLKEVADFEISVAAYPEVHPEAQSADSDLDNLAYKLDCGASRAITQFFFDIDVFLRFRDAATARGINAPIVPGILPVTNIKRLIQFANHCKTSIPNWLKDMLNGLDKDPNSRRLIAGWIAIEQCRQLARHGVTEFHFYTLNRAELTRAICHALGVRDQERLEST